MAAKQKTYLLFGPRVSSETKATLCAEMGAEEIPADFGPFQSGAVHCELFPFLKDERKGMTPEQMQERLLANRKKLKNSHVVLVESTGEQPHVADSIERVRSATATLKLNGVGRISVVMPNAAYDRQDRDFADQGRLCSVNAEWFAKDLKSRGADDVVTCTPHSQDTMGFWRAAFGQNNYHPVDMTSLFVENLRAQFGTDLSNIVVGAPDGAEKPTDNGQIRARNFAAVVHGCTPEEADKHLFKIRKEHKGASETELKSFEGDVAGKDCVIIDDMSDGGSTLLNAARKLKEQGARSVSAYVTHGICSEISKKDLNAFDHLTQSVRDLESALESRKKATEMGLPDLGEQTLALTTLLGQCRQQQSALAQKYQLTASNGLEKLMERLPDGTPLIDHLVTTDSIPEVAGKRDALPAKDRDRVNILSVGKLIAAEIGQLLNRAPRFTDLANRNSTNQKSI